jgi:hypothetical protein
MQADKWTDAHTLPPAVLVVLALIALLLILKVAKAVAKLFLLVVAIVLIVAAWRVRDHYSAADLDRPATTVSTAGTVSAGNPAAGSGGGSGVGPVRRDDAAVGEQFSGVLEEEDAVAEQAPTLLGVARDNVRGLTIGGLS